jgi:C1A family cysteine protease
MDDTKTLDRKFLFPRSKKLQAPSDPRDYNYKPSTIALREAVTLREWDSRVEDQNEASSCVGNAVCNAYELLLKKKSPDLFKELSRLFVYYNARKEDGLTVMSDEGTYVRSALRGLQSHGVCSEVIWPYDITKVNVEPSAEAYAAALDYKIAAYYRLRTINQICDALNNEYPVPYGMEIFDRFYDVDASNPIVNMPYGSEENLGGHAMCLIGYDLAKKLFLAKNSFGTDWGDQGYCWVPFNYIRDYGYDIWVFDISTSQSLSDIH